MTDAMPGKAIELADVSKLYGDTSVVDRVSLAIEEGEFFSLLGPSGCGKSTTLRMISGFETPTRGDIRLRGERVNEVPAHRRATNMVFQHLGLFPHLSVFENVAFGLRLQRVRQDEIARRVAEHLALVNLAGFERRYPDELSGGQQQRVAIARALVNEPAVLLLDEPLGALDLRLRQRMQQELKAIQQRLRTTFVYVTHDQSEAFAMSDRIAIMNAGRLEQVGTPREIYNEPMSEFVASFVGDTNLLEATVIGRDGAHLVVDSGGFVFDAEGAGRSSGERVTVSVRPEHVTLSRAPDGTGIAGTVRSVVFQGAAIHYTVETPAGTPLLVRVAEGGPVADLAPGDAVHASWPADRVRVLPPASGHATP